MLLTRICARGFLALDRIELELGERTTITGPNNVGKSTVLAGCPSGHGCHHGYG